MASTKPTPSVEDSLRESALVHRRGSPAMAHVFFSYSHADEELRNELEKHLAGLRRQGVITTWHDRRIGPGEKLHGHIDEQLNAADTVRPASAAAQRSRYSANRPFSATAGPSAAIPGDVHRRNDHHEPERDAIALVRSFDRIPGFPRNRAAFGICTSGMYSCFTGYWDSLRLPPPVRPVSGNAPQCAFVRPGMSTGAFEALSADSATLTNEPSASKNVAVRAVGSNCRVRDFGRQAEIPERGRPMS